MSAVSLQELVLHRARRGFWRRAWRRIGLAFGYGLIIAGLPLMFVPVVHPGLILVAVGAIIVLRGSRSARRQFIGLQHRHPKLIFPVRRLLRRDPEVFPVAWQQLLRTEKWLLPKRLRFAKALRRRFFSKH